MGILGKIPPDRLCQPQINGEEIAETVRSLGRLVVGSLLCSLLCAGCVSATPAQTPSADSFLYEPAYSLDNALRGTPKPYRFQPGDLVLPTERDIFWTATHIIAGAFQPHHSGIVIALPDGSLGVLEGGPHNTLRIGILDPTESMKEYEEVGPVWVRRRAVPLTEEQSRKLTEFARQVVGKRFAIIRQGAQMTHLGSRGPLRTWITGRSHGPDRSAYFCSELVVEALVAAGLIDEKTARPRATYPRDLFMDSSHNFYLNMHLKLAPDWDPPARWTSDPHGSGASRRSDDRRVGTAPL
jgi:hypothetical protein